MNQWIMLGMLFIFMGIFLILIGSLHQVKNGNTEMEVRGGGVIMIGPVPIVFGSDPRYAIIAILLAIILMVLFIIFSTFL